MWEEKANFEVVFRRFRGFQTGFKNLICRSSILEFRWVTKNCELLKEHRGGIFTAKSSIWFQETCGDDRIFFRQLRGLWRELPQALTTWSFSNRAAWVILDWNKKGCRPFLSKEQKYKTMKSIFKMMSDPEHRSDSRTKNVANTLKKPNTQF